MYRLILSFLPLLSLSIAAAIPQSGGNGLSFEVPPPGCLNTCIHTLGVCTLCTPNNTYAACISSGCGFRDISYADAYYGSICSDGGYLSYDTSPPQIVYLPPAGSNATCNGTANGTAPSTAAKLLRSRVLVR